MDSVDLIVIGGGAAGYFAAINAAGRQQKVILLERSTQGLAKVRISGGGRCNVTHACFDPRELIKFYPRGSKELLGPFTRFQPRDTIEWFKERGVLLKTEEDGRIFPVTDDSETIIQCFKEEIHRAGVEVRYGFVCEKVTHEEGVFKVYGKNATEIHGKKLLLATGSSTHGYEWAKTLGHTIVDPVPSLFTFNVPTSPLLALSGITLPHITLKIEKTKLKTEGPLLLTHWGFSGPAALKLSAWGARELHALDYRATLVVDWTGGLDSNQLKAEIFQYKQKNPHLKISLDPFVSLPRQLEKKLLELAALKALRFAELSLKEIDILVEKLTYSKFNVEGKTTYKQEFVTSGGIKLSEVNFQTMESRICKGLYFAGEILNIDGVTGGFNFQNAWTTSWIVSQSI